MGPWLIAAYWYGWFHPRPKTDPIEVKRRRASFRLVVTNKG